MQVMQHSNLKWNILYDIYICIHNKKYGIATFTLIKGSWYFWIHCVCCPVTDSNVNPGIKEMEAMILECAKLDREINYFVDVVQQVTAEVRATYTIESHWMKTSFALILPKQVSFKMHSWSTDLNVQKGLTAAPAAYSQFFSSVKSQCHDVSLKCHGNNWNWF